MLREKWGLRLAVCRRARAGGWTLEVFSIWTHVFPYLSTAFRFPAAADSGKLTSMAIADVVFCCWIFVFTVIHLGEFCCNGFGAALREHHHVIQMESLVPASTCSGSVRDDAQVGKMRVSHRYGPCSQLKKISPGTAEAEILEQDELRVKNINSKRTGFRQLSGEVRRSRLPTYGGPIGAGNFVVSVGFGTPIQEFTMIFDTGSKLTWIQCAPCSNTSCYPQQDPLYDPSASITYSNASCQPSPSCEYYIEYGDKSSSSGHLVRDTLTLTTPSDTYSNFVFGCGETNQGNFGTAAGVLGFGSDLDPLSFLSQTAGISGLIFCYCLPAADGSNGHLSFGSEALSTCSSEIYTSLIQYQNSPSFYYITLNGITLGGQQLEISPFLTIIDSGTVITRLPPSIYSALRSAFMEQMSQYPMAQPFPPLMDTCYNLTAYANFTAPEIVLQLEKSREVRLHPSAVVWIESSSRVCLAFAGNKQETDKAIIGNHQQRTLNILYDIRAMELAFASQGC